MIAGEREAKARHIDVDRLILPGLHQIRFVKDADDIALADFPVEALPCGQVRIVGVAGKVFKLFKRAPILHQQDRRPRQVRAAAQHAFFGMGVQFTDHRPHRVGNGQPLVNGERLVDLHPDEEHNK